MTDATGPATGPSAGAPASTAGLGLRFAARLLDALIVGIPLAIILNIAGLGTGGFGASGFIGSAISSLIFFGYYVYFESTTGATLGKKIVKARVVGADGNPPAMDAAAKRNVWMLFGIVPIIGGLAGFVAVIVIAVTISSNEFNRGKHDEFAGTGVMV